MSESYWLCDYDLPAEPMSRRTAFYKARKKAILRAIRDDPTTAIVYSSQSVIVTSNPTLAARISDLAKTFDARVSHTYCLSALELVSSFENPTQHVNGTDTSQTTLDSLNPKFPI